MAIGSIVLYSLWREFTDITAALYTCELRFPVFVVTLLCTASTIIDAVHSKVCNRGQKKYKCKYSRAFPVFGADI